MGSLTESLDDEALHVFAQCLNSNNQQLISSSLDVLLSISVDTTDAFHRLDFHVLKALLRHLLRCQQKTSNDTEVVETPLVVLVNITAHSKQLSKVILENITDKELVWLFDLSKHASSSGLRAVQLLANLTHHCPDEFSKIWSDNGESIISLILSQLASTSTGFENAADYHGFVLMNLSTVPTIREDIAKRHLTPILSLFQSNVPSKRRWCAASTMYNISHDADLHLWLLTECWLDPALELDKDAFLVAILSPIADSKDTLSDEETEKLPIPLQYYDGHREKDKSILQKLLETLYQLCATKVGRETLRANGVYALLRELDRWLNSLNTSKRNDNDDRMLISDVSNGSKDLSDEEDIDVNVLHAIIGVLIRYEEEMCIDNDDPTFSLKDLQIENSA